MTLYSPEHAVLVDNPTLFATASKTYSEEAAVELIDALIASYDMGHDYLPILSPVERIGIQIQENNANQPVEGRAQLKNGSLTLGLNSSSSVEDIISQLPDVVTHELAHLIHIQRNPLFFALRRDANNLHFGSAIMEGVAAHAGRCLGAFSVYSENMFRQQKVIDALVQLLDNPDTDQLATYDTFMSGTKDFSNRGYRVGEFVVANMADAMNSSTLELMELSLGEYSEYAESLIRSL